MMLAYC